MSRLITLVLLLFISNLLSAKTIYVNSTVATPGDGSTWNQAFNKIEDAISTSISGDEIWIAQGEYSTPMSVDNLSRLPFILTKSLSFYGGFTGNESSVSDRPQMGAETVISSSFDQTLYNSFEVSASNLTLVFDKLTFSYCRRVLYSDSQQKSNNYKLNDLIIENIKEVSGFGIIEVDECAFVRFNMTSCNFNNNEGSVFIANSNNVEMGNYTSKITNCVFENNPKPFIYYAGVDSISVDSCNFSNQMLLNSSPEAKLDAFHVQKAVNFEIKNSTFQSLYVKNYALCFLTVKNLTIDKCTILNNSIDVATTTGSFLFFSEVTAMSIKNSLIAENNSGNTAFILGTDIYSSKRCNINFENCTLTNNTFAGICNVKASMFALADILSIQNSIIWNNQFSATLPIGLKATVTVNYSSIQSELQQYEDLVTNTTNIFNDPQLTPNYTLSCTSPCVNAGINPTNFNSLTDLAGNLRVQNGIIDLGAYESPCDVATNINELENEPTIRFYPNPVKDVCQVIYNEITRVQVFKTDGTLVKDVEVTTNEYTIYFLNEKSGLYLVKVYNNKGEVLNSKIIKE